jgi:hypothetical protein
MSIVSKCLDRNFHPIESPHFPQKERNKETRKLAALG